MNNQWTFLLEAPWVWVLTVACLTVFVFCLLAEFRKGRTGNIWLRAVLLLLAHASLLLTAQVPAYRQSLPTAKAIVLQPDARQEALDSLLDLYPGVAVYSLRHEAAGVEEAIPHAAYLQQKLSAGSTVYLLGSGLDREELSYLQAYELNFLPTALPYGIRSLSYNRDLQLGDTLKLRSSGLFEQDSLWLRLSLAGTTSDSILLRGGKAESLLLRAQPPVSGVLEYRLDLLTKNSDSLESHSFLVNVHPNRTVKLALLTAYPSFEVKYLKNWLADEGHSVYYQAEMAPGRFSREWLNMAEKPYSLNQELLQAVDIIIMDQAYWNNLTGAHIRELEEAVQQQGLGCLVLGESGLWRPSASGWSTLPDLQISARTQAAPAGRSKHDEGAVLSSYIARPGNWLPLLSNAEESPLLLFRPQGLGRIGVSLLESTYPLLLSDQDAAYSRLWTNILNSLIKTTERQDAIEVDFPAFTGSRNHLQFWQKGPEMQEIVLAEPNQHQQVLPLVQDQHIPALWHAYFWPRVRGEHRLNIQGGDSLSFIVYQANALPAMQKFRVSRDTYSFVEENQRQETAGTAQGRSESVQGRYKVVSPVWFYCLFLLSMAGLWIERKLSGT